ncbi:MAG: ribosome biogenesis GTPase Der [bacterium]
MLPKIALVGRPNVGKSTLFNILTRTREALVADYPGLTRDRKYGAATLDERKCIIIDTGGLLELNDDSIVNKTSDQVWIAIEESDLVLFILDARTGLTPDDEHIAARLRRTGKTIFPVVNKIDGLNENTVITDFYKLGFSEPYAIAASHRRGTGQLSTMITDLLPEQESAGHDEQSDRLKVAVIGRPNVGKSTLINRILGEERLMALDHPGTTRDAIDVDAEWKGNQLTMVDTAGVRRRGRVSEMVEKFTALKSLEAIERARVSILVVDATEGIVDQDSHLLGQILRAGKAFIVAVNKWDDLTHDQRAQTLKTIDRKLSFVPYVVVCKISALHGSGLTELMNEVFKASEAASLQVSANKISSILEKAMIHHQPPMSQGRTAKLRYAHLGGHDPLKIIIHGSRTKTLPESYRRFLANHFRNELKLTAMPLVLEFRDSANPFEGKKNKLTGRQIKKKQRMKKFTKKSKR